MSTFTGSRAMRVAALVLLAAGLGGCITGKDVTGSIAPVSANREVATATPADKEARWRALEARYAADYEKNPSDAATAYAYGQTLRALGKRAQALAVLEAASIKNPEQKQILAAYGRALADIGRYEDALGVLGKAHSPDRPDWKILNAQGAIMDQMNRPEEARRYYEAALKVAPGEPAVLSNLGLSYALSKDLTKAEATLILAADSPKADDQVRANLAMVRGLKGGAPEKITVKKAAEKRG